MKTISKFLKNEQGDAVVEATFLFPIIMLIFAAFMVVAMILPQKVVLDRAVEKAAVILANMQSDTGYNYNTNTMKFSANFSDLPNVYVRLFKTLNNEEIAKGEQIIKKLNIDGLLKYKPNLTKCDIRMNNYFIYKEIEINAVNVIKLPLDFSFIGLGKSITVNSSAKCVVQNNDEFIRNIDIAADIAVWVDKKLGVSKKIMDAVGKVKKFFKS